MKSGSAAKPLSQPKTHRVAIVCGGPLGDTEVTAKWIGTADVIICADGGLAHATNLTIVPDIVVGDVDSVDLSLVQSVKGQGTEIISFPTEKSKTDGELALEKAIKFSPQTIEIYGAIGGRLDHTLANLSILYKVPRDIRAELVDTSFEPPCRTFLLHAGQRYNFKNETGQKFSLLTLEPDGAVVTITGAEYDLDCKLLFPCSRGIGNRVKNKDAYVMVHQGTLICMTGYSGQSHPEK